METNATPYPNQEIWFLTGSQGLYGEDILHQVAKQSGSISEILGTPGSLLQSPGRA